MGLDCYFEFPDVEDGDEPEPDRDLHLVGGMLSGHGDGSFRGKVYHRFIEEATGYSIYNDLDNDDVAAIAERLESLEWDEAFADGYRNPEGEQEFDDLAHMFRFYADEGAGLVAWY